MKKVNKIRIISACAALAIILVTFIVMYADNQTRKIKYIISENTISFTVDAPVKWNNFWNWTASDAKNFVLTAECAEKINDSTGLSINRYKYEFQLNENFSAGTTKVFFAERDCDVNVAITVIECDVQIADDGTMTVTDIKRGNELIDDFDQYLENKTIIENVEEPEESD